MTYEEDHRRIGEQIDQLAAKRAYAPHCDARVLHRPDTCWSCDGYPDWQSARLTWQINFTGENDKEKLPCPAELARPVEVINRWGGNRPDATTFGEYYQDLAARAREFGGNYANLISRAKDADPQSVKPGDFIYFDFSGPPPHETRLQRLRRHLSDFIHFHF